MPIPEIKQLKGYRVVVYNPKGENILLLTPKFNAREREHPERYKYPFVQMRSHERIIAQICKAIMKDKFD